MRERFSEEFQRDAVRMLENGERTKGQQSSSSQETGVSEWSLKRWAKFHGPTNQAKERASCRSASWISLSVDLLLYRHKSSRAIGFCCRDQAWHMSFDFRFLDENQNRVRT